MGTKDERIPIDKEGIHKLLDELEKSDRLVTITISVDREGNIFEDTQCHGNSWADVYRGKLLVKARLEELVARRRECPFNPKYGSGLGGRI